MQAYISHIFIFNNEDKIRSLEFTEGLNIISGDSKTGKSAIIEILDYCLFATTSTIPKGIITEWTDLFCVIIKVLNKNLILARKKNSNEMYFCVETHSKFLLNFSKKYFDDKNLMNFNIAKVEFEKHLGISVLDTRADEDINKQSSGGKVTMRSFIPFLFQHQNLIANKHSLFYRFDDFYKRKKTIDDYPILMGWGNAEYFDLLRSLDKKQKELTHKKRLDNKLKISNDQLKEDLLGLLSIYYTFLGRELSTNFTIQELKKIANDLPIFNNKSLGDQNIKEELKNIDLEILNKKKILEKVINSINTIESNNNISKNYYKNITRLKSLASIETDINEAHCPLCEQEVVTIKEKINLIKESNELLEEELNKIGTYTSDSFKESDSLRNQRDSLKRELRDLNLKAEELNKQVIAEYNTKNEYDKALLLKGRTEANAQNLIDRNKILNDTNNDYSELEKEIDELKRKLEGFNLKDEILRAQVILSEKMTKICNSLDFEDEFKPGKIYFDLENFTLKYNYNKNENILLSEMGSGSNWLAIHLSTFLGFLYLHSAISTSKIPSILVLDQPSQVYFPKVYKELDDDDSNDLKKIDDNILQVKNIFKVISQEIDNIEIEFGYKPQVIVLEHADEDEFSQFIKYRWKKEGKKLI